MTIVTDWVKPAFEIRGQDHLAVRAPCEFLYGRLLPGITNVTDRARYYTFYPWIVWALEKYSGPLKQMPFEVTLRRADCLFTLIGSWHTTASADKVPVKHGRGLVGREKLLAALAKVEAGDFIKLSVYATTDDDPTHRYFKNRLGGLGQYYFGTLRDLGLLDGDTQTGIKYTHQRGGYLAEALDAGVNRNLFFETLENDLVDLKTLSALSAFCPCHLSVNVREQTALIELFFNQERFYIDEGEERRRTLGLLLSLAEKLGKSDNLYADAFRDSVYAGTLPNGELWELPAALASTRAQWHNYQRSELLSIAIQGLFWAGLDRLKDSGNWLANSEAYRDWFLDEFVKDNDYFDFHAAVTQAIDKVFENLPAIEDLSAQEHEINYGRELADIKNCFEGHARHIDVFNRSLYILLALAVRAQTVEYDNNHSDFPPYYPIHPKAFHKHLNSCESSALKELVSWLAYEWGIETHFRVALRKLRGELRDTFRIKPTDEGLLVVEAPVPVFSSPRITQAIQILTDLGAFDVDKENLRELTARGSSLLREYYD